jgi:hypothetical protein
MKVKVVLFSFYSLSQEDNLKVNVLTGTSRPGTTFGKAFDAPKFQSLPKNHLSNITPSDFCEVIGLAYRCDPRKHICYGKCLDNRCGRRRKHEEITILTGQSGWTARQFFF